MNATIAQPPSDSLDTATRRVLATIGAEMVSAGMTVTDVEFELQRLSARLGHPWLQVSATPTHITLALAPGEPATMQRMGGPLRLDQSLVVRQVRHDLLGGRIAVPEALEQIRRVRQLPLRYGRWGVYLGNMVVAAGICLIMQPGVANVLLAALCSLVVSFLIRSSGRHALLAALLPSLAALSVSLVVLGAWHAGMLQGPLRTLICPIAVLLPGALLSTGIAELATGSMISGTSRFLYGIVQLLLFALGVVAAAMLLKVPTAALTNTRVDELGVLAAPAGLALIAVGIMLSEGVPLRIFGWTAAVLVATFAAQQYGQAQTDSLPLGAFLGATTASFLSTAVESTRRNVPRLVLFLPSFWLLVPGTLGLMGITTVGAGTGTAEAVTGVLTLITSIALGLLVGSALALPLNRLTRRLQHVVHR
ncbi:threonine/serine ThrE exporter family protein [Luteococcus peritonei]|uniref:Threonine/serine exporter ThrE family protein n=1 Tax=Luteococcus peritonei TaxID=88874 RepID=A0ABW4RUH9_9ACTN